MVNNGGVLMETNLGEIRRGKATGEEKSKRVDVACYVQLLLLKSPFITTSPSPSLPQTGS